MPVARFIESVLIVLVGGFFFGLAIEWEGSNLWVRLKANTA
jgi:hypothetical protein